MSDPKDTAKLHQPSYKMGGGVLAADGACCIGKGKYLHQAYFIGNTFLLSWFLFRFVFKTWFQPSSLASN